MDNNYNFLSNPVEATKFLVNIRSESKQEKNIADEMEKVLNTFPELTVNRFHNTIVANTNFTKDKRVILAGHLDTVPIAENIPVKEEVSKGETRLVGCGTADMKSGDAVFLSTLFDLPRSKYDLTFVFYESEEIAAKYSGLNYIPLQLLKADLAILGEPTNGIVELGCQGSIRFSLTAKGVRAHSARSWLGDNAIHKLGKIISFIADYVPKTVEIDDCLYKEGISIVNMEGGVAGNVIPDLAEIRVNYRYAPDKNTAQAEAYIYEIFDEFLSDSSIELKILDHSSAAPPNLHVDIIRTFINETGLEYAAKYGWTDVAKFAELGIPAINFGPGNPNLAHKPEEYVEINAIKNYFSKLSNFLLEAN